MPSWDQDSGRIDGFFFVGNRFRCAYCLYNVMDKGRHGFKMLGIDYFLIINDQLKNQKMYLIINYHTMT